MAWKDVKVDEQRIRFVLRADSGAEEMAGLCREFEISRTTGYYWLRRYREGERMEELRERSRRPHHSPRRTAEEIEQRVVEERQRRPDWGARKLRVLLAREGIRKPSSTIHRILRRRDLIRPHQQHPPALKRFQREQPNQLWQMDFKGLPANLAQGCMPLSIVDDCSRYAVALESLRGTQRSGVQRSFGAGVRGNGIAGGDAAGSWHAVVERTASQRMDAVVDLADEAERAAAFLGGAASADARQGGTLPPQPAGCLARTRLSSHT